MKNPWRHINKCFLCGSNLIFEQSRQEDTSRFAGIKFCESQHGRFLVEATVIDKHWDIRIKFPNSRKGHIYG